MFSAKVLNGSGPNMVSYEAMFGKKRNFKYMIAVGVIWQNAEGVLLHGDDAKQSSSEPAGGNGTPEAWETGSDSTTPPMCQPLPSGKIMNVPDGESVITGDTRHQVEVLLDQNDEDCTATSYQGNSLIVACEISDMVAVDRLLDNGDTNVNDVDELGKTALHAASENGCDDIVRTIVTHADIDINKRNKEGQSALVVASIAGHAEVARILSQNPKIEIDDVHYCMYTAACFSHVEVLSCLLEHSRIDVNWDGGIGITALLSACQSGSLLCVQKLLEQNGIEVNTASTDNGATPLFTACGYGHLEIVEKLLDRNEIEVNKARIDNGVTPFFIACQQGHLEIVEKLLERNEIEVSKARTDNGATPLFMACGKGHLEIVEKLLERKEIEVNKAMTTDGSTPLFMACQKGHLEIVEKLLEQKEIEVNKGQNDGQTPLTKASQQGHLEIVQKLLQRNEIQVNDAYADQFTPENRNTIQAGSTALIFATYFGHQAVVQQLLSHPNTQIDQQDDHNNTAMIIAEREGHEEIATLLRDHSAKN